MRLLSDETVNSLTPCSGGGKAGRVGLQGVSTAVLQVNGGRPERGRPPAMMEMYGKIEVSMNRTGIPLILMKNAVDTRG